MAAKKIVYDQEAREAIKEGVKILAKVVKITLGPRGPQCGPGEKIRGGRPLPRTA